jgi:hypothetical protein
MHPHHYRPDDAIVWKEGKIYRIQSSACLQSPLRHNGGVYSQQRVVGKRDKIRKKTCIIKSFFSLDDNDASAGHSIQDYSRVYTRYYSTTLMYVWIWFFFHVIGDAFFYPSLLYRRLFFHLTLFIIFKSNVCRLLKLKFIPYICADFVV